MPVSFTGTLNANEIFASIFNMIISQHVFADNIVHKYSLVERFRVDGTLFGDTKLFYAPDALKTTKWGADAEATNLLQLHRPKAPQCQKVTINIFRQISLTIDNYLTKRAWADEYSFSMFNSVMVGMMSTTKDVYENTLFNTFVGTTESSVGNQLQNVKLSDYESVTDLEAKARLRAQRIAKTLADIFVELGDYSRKWNDYGNIRAYDEDSFIIVGNSKYINEITLLDLPTIFHQDGLSVKDKMVLLPSRYFGVPVTVTGTAITADGTTIRSLIEQDITVRPGEIEHVFAGDLIPTGVVVASTTDVVYPSYTQKDDVICKIVHKNGIPFMSAFEAGTSFFNPKSLTENRYLTFGHSTLDYLANYPFITLHEN